MMCLSTPVANPNKTNSTTETCNSVDCNDNNNSSNCNANNSTLNCSLQCTDMNSNSCNIKHRLTQTKAFKDATVDKTAHNPTQPKDLANSLGYKEENAVYKEIPRATENGLQKEIKSTNEVEEYHPKIRWPDLIAQIFLHTGALYGIYLLFSAKFYTLLWITVVVWISGIGITAGAHRLWSHKSYTAAFPLRVLLILLFTIAGQRDAYTWALDHRIHHKFSETEADPHNAKRGFFFAHVGWLFLTPHPAVIKKRKVIDMSDLENDKVVMFQRKWYIPMFAVLSIAFPVLVPVYFWQENLWLSFWINFNLRFCCTLNAAFFVNSVAHMWGSKPYDKNISPVESPLVAFMAMGEGWHNYHHVFPWDYKTGEFGSYKLNITTGFIDLCAKFGLANGRKFVSPDMIERRAQKCGDGTRFLTDECAHKDQVWGYGDRDLLREDAEELVKMQD